MKRFSHTVAALTFLFALFTIVCSAKVWSVDDVPMVHLLDRTKYVCDPESLLSRAMRDSSDCYLRKLHKEYGIQTVFVIVDSVQNADCFRMAQGIGNKYGVGTRKERRGLVLIIAVKDRRYFVAPGKGLEEELTDIECNDIGRVCIAGNMRVNNVDMAVMTTSKTLYSKFKTGRTGVDQIDEAEGKRGESVAPLVFLLLLFFGIPLLMLIRYILELFGIVKKFPGNAKRHDDDDWIPPFIFGGGGVFRHSDDGFKGGDFGGGSFGGGGAGGGW